MNLSDAPTRIGVHDRKSPPSPEDSLRTIILGLYRGLDQRLGRIHRAGQGGILEMPLVVDWSQAVIFLR
jgi:hypothetical protein